MISASKPPPMYMVPSFVFDCCCEYPTGATDSNVAVCRRPDGYVP